MDDPLELDLNFSSSLLPRSDSLLDFLDPDASHVSALDEAASDSLKERSTGTYTCQSSSSEVAGAPTEDNRNSPLKSPTALASSVVAVAADASLNCLPSAERLETPDVDMIELEFVKHPESIKDLSFGFRRCKIFYNHGTWKIKFRCPKGFAVDAMDEDLHNVTFTLMDFSANGMRETKFKGTMFQAGKKKENGQVVVIIKAKTSQRMAPFPYGSFAKDGSVTVFQLWASWKGVKVVSYPFIFDTDVEGKYLNSEESWTNFQKDSLNTALRMIPVNKVSSSWKLLLEEKTITEKALVAQQLNAIFAHSELKELGQFAYEKYQFGENYDSPDLLRNTILKDFVLDRPPPGLDGKEKMIVRAACYVDTVRHVLSDGRVEDREEICFCCCIPDKDLRLEILREHPKYKIPGEEPNPDQDHCFLTLRQVLQYCNDICWLPPWSPSPPEKISDRRPAVDESCKARAEAETTRDGGKRGSSEEIAALAAVSAIAMARQLAKEFGEFESKTPAQMEDLQQLVGQFFRMTLGAESLQKGKRLRDGPTE